MFTAVIDWGDGSPTEPAGIAGRDYVASQRQGRSLMSVSGSHTYPADEVYHGTVTYSHQDQTWVVPFIATGVPSCTKTIIGTHYGPLTVSSGVTCLEGATITGPVTVRCRCRALRVRIRSARPADGVRGRRRSAVRYHGVRAGHRDRWDAGLARQPQRATAHRRRSRAR